MADLIGGTILAIVGVITLTALFVTTAYLMPQRTARAHQLLQAQPGRALLIGLVNALFFGLLAAVLAQLGDLGGLLALLLLLALGALAAVGVAGAVRLLHARMFINEANEAESVKGLGKTAVWLILAALSPLLGWFVLTPLLLLAGLGAALMTIVGRKRPSSENETT